MTESSAAMLSRLRPLLVAPRPLSEVLRVAIGESPDLLKLIADGASVPENEIGWLDALRKGELPCLWWEIVPDAAGGPGYDFGQPPLSAFSTETIKLFIAAFLSNRIIASRVGKKYDEDDPNLGYRINFRQITSEIYRNLFVCIRGDHLIAKGFRVSSEKTEHIDAGIFEGASDYFIHLREDDIYRHDGTLVFRTVKIGLTEVVEAREARGLRRDSRGGATSTDWPEIVKHFIAYLYYNEKSWPRTHSEAVKVVRSIIDYIGYIVEKDETISKAMMREASLLWEMFPKGITPGEPRFHQLTKKTVAGEVEETH